ncbi:MAG TPA: hypothetical protein VD970_05230 [Acetobacteraceae bacterium]|nr:hypothetical protein [Acetobacteraceae bacterium]
MPDSKHEQKTVSEETTVAGDAGFSGPKPRPRDKAPERQYSNEVGGQAAAVGTGQPKRGAKVNIPVKGGR